MSGRFKRCKSGKDLDDLFNGEDRNGGNPGGGGKPGGGGGKPGGGPKRAGSASAGAATASSERRYKPPRQFAAERVRRGFDEVHVLTPLSPTNLRWLAAKHPRMEYDGDAIFGRLDMRAAWDPETGEMAVNPDTATPWMIEDSYDLRILLQYPTRWLGDIPHRAPQVFEISGRTRALAEKTGINLVDLHMYPDDGECCIGIAIAPPSKNHFDLAGFIEIEVISWLYRFAYVERFGLERARQDLWREYDHSGGPQQHIDFLHWIASQKPKDNSPCPCGKGTKYLRCHKREVKTGIDEGHLKLDASGKERSRS